MTDGKKACAAQCNAGLPCAIGETCTKHSPRDVASPFVCIVTAAPVTCQACIGDSDCRTYGSACMQGSDSKACGIDCSLVGDAACPSGHSCVTLKDKDGNETAKQCVPQAGACTTFTAPPAPLDPDTPTPPGTSGPVTPVDPSCHATGAEVCDGVDNDCDGKIDEGPDGKTLTRSCGVGLGVCVGVQQCNGPNSWSLCNAPSPVAETCNQKDDDCDGSVDEEVNTSPDTCGDTCSPCPGGGSIASSLRSCVPSGNKYVCAFTCRSNYYDVNNDLSDGCEKQDDPSGHDYSTATFMGEISDEEGGASVAADGYFPADARVHEQSPVSRNTPQAQGSLAQDWYVFKGVDTGGDDMEFTATLDARSLAPGNAYEICLTRQKDQPVTVGCSPRPSGALTWQSSNTGCACAMGGNRVTTLSDYDYDPWVPRSYGFDDTGNYWVRVRWISGSYAPQSGNAYSVKVQDD